jgi:uncharacterized protein (DUF486 family)
MNDLSRIIIFSILLLFASGFYSFANFRENKVNSKINIISQKFLIILAMAVGFASIEYLFKIPGFILIKDVLSPVQIQMVWLFGTSISVILFQTFYLKQIIQPHSYISFALISVILIIEMYNK